jgi:hypothetical protein
MGTVKLKLDVLLDVEISTLVAHWLPAREEFSIERPELAAVYHALLSVLDDERRRRAREHRRIVRLMQGSDPDSRPPSGWVDHPPEAA